MFIVPKYFTHYEIIQESVSNAAAYIQHVTYGDDVMKSLLRRKGVVPVLVGIINNNTHHKVRFINTCKRCKIHKNNSLL